MSKQARTVTNPYDPVVSRAVDMVNTYGDTDSHVTALNHVSVEFQPMQVCSLSPRLERRYSMNRSFSTCASMAPSIS